MKYSNQKLAYQDIVLNTIREPIYAIDTEGNIVVWNQAMVEITGLSEEEVLNNSFFDYFHCIDGNDKHCLQETKEIFKSVEVNGNEFRTHLEPIMMNGASIGFRGGLYALNEGVLKSIPRDHLVDVINASPISTIVFNTDGSIMFSNNAYSKMWKLNIKELEFINRKYNIFLDKQLERQGLMPLIHKAFAGEVQQSPIANYRLKSSRLGRVKNENKTQLIAYIFPIKDTKKHVSFVVLNFLDVTKQYNLEKALVEHKERLQLAVEGGNLGTWDMSLDTGKLIYNERWANMLGYELEEAYGLTWENLLHEDDKENALKEFTKLKAGELAIYESEFRLKTKEGKWKWILDRGKVVERKADGMPSRLAGTHIDIDERKKSEEKQRRNEEKYRRLVENAPIGIGILADEKLVYLNNALMKMGGVDAKELVLGAPAERFIPAERYALFMERYHLVVDKGENAPLYTTQLKPVVGDIIDVEVASIPTTFKGQPAMQVLIHDVTTRKKALEELAKSRELQQQLFENAPLGIVLLDDQFKVKQLNRAFEEIFGFSKEELSDQSLTDFIVSPELMDEAEELNASALKGKIIYFESYRYNKVGEKIPVIIYALPVMNDGKHIGIYGIYIDISQRTKAEDELKIRNLELDNFVYKVSHDLRAPLASILGLIGLTKLEHKQKDQDYYIKLMEGQVQKLDYFIRDILSHSKNLKMSVSSDKIDFHEIVNKCFDELSYLKASSKIIRKITITNGEFYSDKWRINEIFRNLISNAIKYLNPETDKNIVEININADLKGCNIIIEDNGIGITKESLPRVMEMFYRGTEVSDGSGIGLYIVQKAVEKIKGTIQLESLSGRGTKFSIWLPSIRNLIKD